MKIYVKSNSFDGYLYIFKHGLGPGTIPKDVAIVKEKDLPNGYTAVWLDRFLRTDELKAYDIPSETEINRYLDRIGYCQKGGDVVPCDEVDACGAVEAAKSSKVDILDKYIGNDVWLKVKISEKAYFRRGYTYNEYWIRILDKDGESYIVNKVSAYKEYKGNNTQKSASQSKTYTIDKNAITVLDPIQTTTTDKIFDDVEASGDIKASDMYEDDDFYWEDYGSEDSYGGFESPEAFAAWQSNLGPRLDKSDVEASDTEYFANMVSASNDPELDDDFLIEGYYDNQRRGLAESAETSDVSALNELANEYANKGYYIVVHNLTDGTITEFSADNWFNDIAPDGGAGLFMSW